jgi:methyl-accepting chemotaxis protein
MPFASKSSSVTMTVSIGASMLLAFSIAGCSLFGESKAETAEQAAARSQVAAARAEEAANKALEASADAMKAADHAAAAVREATKEMDRVSARLEQMEKEREEEDDDESEVELPRTSIKRSEGSHKSASAKPVTGASSEGKPPAP